MSAAGFVPGIRLTLPGTSANLGPGFDAAGLALSMHLAIEAREAHVSTGFEIAATGRDAELCGALDRNLIIDTYSQVMEQTGRKVTPLKLKLHNEIPLGMGCGSSAAALLAGVALADHFGGLGLGDAGIVAEASKREGHPDNVAASWFGGFTVSCQDADKVEVAHFAGNAEWELMLALPTESLSTHQARALLPAGYSKADAVFNVQRVSLLVAAFAQGRLNLLRTATQDRMHQPYRAEVCPLLKQLLPLADEPEIAGVALSGAGPSVLVFLSEGTTALEAETRMRAVVGPDVELLSLRIADGAKRVIL